MEEEKEIVNSIEQNILDMERRKRLKEARMFEDNEQAIEDERIKNKRENQSLEQARLERERVAKVEDFETFVFDMIGDLNDLFLLGYKGRLNNALVSKMTELTNKMNNKKKELVGINVVLNPTERNEMRNINTKVKNGMKNVIIPQITKDELKKTKFKSVI